jgi:hypothetical protein
MLPAARSRSKLTVWTMVAGFLALVCISIVSLAQFGFLLGRAAHAQGKNEIAKPAAGSTTPIEKTRALIRELEAQIVDLRGQVQKLEVTLGRARTILADLDRSREVSGGIADPPPSVPGLDPSWEQRERYLSEQSIAEKTPWLWPAETATPEACARGFGDGYEVEIVQPKEPSLSPTIRVRKNGEDIVAWRAHSASVFVRRGDMLYYADFSPSASGCRIVGYHLQAREEIWKTPLLGVGRLAHSMYHNRVNMKLDNRHLIIYGDEAASRYIELLDPFTGRIVGHRLWRG